MKYCKYCGAKLQEGMIYCHKCGKNIVGQNRIIPSNLLNCSAKTITILAIFILIVVSALWAYNSNSSFIESLGVKMGIKTVADRDRLYLVGLVKSVKTEYNSGNSHNVDVLLFNEQGNLTYEEHSWRRGIKKTYNQYDSKRRIIEKKQTFENPYRREETEVQVSKYQYDTEYPTVTTEVFDSSNNIVRKYIGELDNQNLDKSGTWYDKNNKIISKVTFNYNRAGFLLESIETSSSGEQLKHTTNTYDSKNKIIDEVVYSKGGNSEHRQMKYDDRGFMTERSLLNNNSTSNKIVYTYVVDEKGNWIKQHSDNKGIQPDDLIRSIEYY